MKLIIIDGAIGLQGTTTTRITEGSMKQFKRLEFCGLQLTLQKNKHSKLYLSLKQLKMLKFTIATILVAQALLAAPLRASQQVSEPGVFVPSTSKPNSRTKATLNSNYHHDLF